MTVMEVMLSSTAQRHVAKSAGTVLYLQAFQAKQDIDWFTANAQ